MTGLFAPIYGGTWLPITESAPPGAACRSDRHIHRAAHRGAGIHCDHRYCDTHSAQTSMRLSPQPPFHGHAVASFSSCLGVSTGTARTFNDEAFRPQ